MQVFNVSTIRHTQKPSCPAFLFPSIHHLSPLSSLSALPVPSGFVNDPDRIMYRPVVLCPFCSPLSPPIRRESVSVCVFVCGKPCAAWTYFLDSFLLCVYLTVHSSLHSSTYFFVCVCVYVRHTGMCVNVFNPFNPHLLHFFLSINKSSEIKWVPVQFY